MFFKKYDFFLNIIFYPKGYEGKNYEWIISNQGKINSEKMKIVHPYC